MQNVEEWAKRCNSTPLHEVSNTGAELALSPAKGCWLCPTLAGTARGRWHPTPPAHTDGLGDHAGPFLRHQQET